MAQATKPKPTKPTKPTKEGAARVNRANKAINEILDRENVTLTINRIQIFTKEADRTVPAGELAPSALARLCGFPEGTLLFPRVEIQAKPNGKNGG